jgi:uncharacterized protein YprB with RNaseH-like and TPR domain
MASANDRRDLRRRLSRLNRRQSAQPQSTPEPVGLPPGEELETEDGPAYRVSRQFTGGHEHGAKPLSALLDYNQDTPLAAEISRDPGLAETGFDRLAYLDTETTGLSGGAGALVFLVGVGRFLEDGFVVRQYFLRNPAEESSMLRALQQELAEVDGFVTFNGRAFDIPLLEDRYVIGLRQRLDLRRRPHFDLLYPSRRLWRMELPDCTLGTLESNVLGVRRDEADVPGAEIPGMYLDYLRSGNAAEMRRVLYHNEIDILSLVGLTTEILTRHSPPQAEALTPAEALAIARWHEADGRVSSAEAAYQLAAGSQAQSRVRVEAMRRYARQLKRLDRREEAVEWWRAWSEADPDDPRPAIELSMHHEWQTKDLDQARAWAEAARTRACGIRPAWRRDIQLDEIDHRLARIDRKLKDRPS